MFYGNIGMNEIQKPFACSVKGCEMTFTTEDHLNVHQKKHDLMLNCGLATKTCDVADQTPTPTRFLRNCDEVGLFQDLQIVNPFDEVFKKAAENAKLDNITFSDTHSDDTLHTPHILPHLQECEGKYHHKVTNSCGQNQPYGLSVNNVISLQYTNENSVKTTPVIIIHNDTNDSTNICDSTNNKQKTSKQIEVEVNSQILLSAGKENEVHKINQKEKSSNENPEVNAIKEKIRIMNRAAQYRCRKRKQVQRKKMEEEMLSFKTENKKLRIENIALKSENIKLKEVLLKLLKKSDSEKDQSYKSSVVNQNEPSVFVHLINPTPGNVCFSLLENSSSNSEIKANTFIPFTNDKSTVLLQNPKHSRSKKFRKIVPKT